MVCLLYRECLCLASAGKSDQTYTIQACLALSGINVEDVDNGRGRIPSCFRRSVASLSANS